MRSLALVLVACSANPGDPGTIDAAPPKPDASPFDAPPPPMSWMPAGGNWTGVACRDGLRYQAMGSFIYACTPTGGFRLGTVNADSTVTWVDSNAGIDNLNGAAIATHPSSVTQLAYVASPSGSANVWFRSSDGGMNWTGMPVTDGSGDSLTMDAYKFQPSVGNMMGSWQAGQATVLTARPTPAVPHAVATATGVVTGLAGAIPSDLFAAVNGKTPAGDAATGGIFHSTDGAGATWSESDTGIAADDLARLHVLVEDPIASSTLYVGLDGGGLLYKTTDDGAHWAMASSGLPAGASIVAITLAPSAIYASTSAGLYASTDGAASWFLAGFAGQSVLSVAADPAGLADRVFVAVDDATGLYQPTGP